MTKRIETVVHLITPEGVTTALAEIIAKEVEAGTRVELNLTYNNKIYRSSGTDCLWVDAFADLANQLPNGIQLASCMTCRHGNMCPYGTQPGQLFCTRDMVITDKNDMCSLFDNNDAFGKRETPSYAYCESFEAQSEDYYTYSDYLYQLVKKRNNQTIS